jgi:hypothetical protein
MVFDHREKHPSLWAAICSMTEKLGMAPEILGTWVRRAENDDGLRPGLTTGDRSQLPAELRRPAGTRTGVCPKEFGVVAGRPGRVSRMPQLRWMRRASR